MTIPALDNEKLPVADVGTSQGLLATAPQLKGSAHAPLAVSVTGCGVIDVWPTTPANVRAVGNVVVLHGAASTKLT